MDQAILVSPDIEIGSRIVAALDEAGIKPVVAMMAALPDYEDWRLLLSSPAVDQTRLLKAHETVAKILHGKFSKSLPLIIIYPTKDPFIRELRRMFGKSKSVTGMRIGGQKIGNRFVDSAYVYRIA